MVGAAKNLLLAIPWRLRQEDPDLSVSQVGLVEKLIREALSDLAHPKREGKADDR